MEKIIDYVVLEHSPRDMPAKVLELIAKGWQPLGGIAASLKTNGVMQCYQAMVLYAK
jgi:hypothetical protein